MAVSISHETPGNSRTVSYTHLDVYKRQHQWTPKNPEAQGTVPDAHDPSKRHAPMMLTTDLSLKLDPIYGPIAKRFHENPDQLADAFARAWYKLLHLSLIHI